MNKSRALIANTSQPRTIRKALFNLEDDGKMLERLQNFVKLDDNKWVEPFNLYNHSTKKRIDNVIGYCNEEGMLITGTKPMCNNGITPIYGPAIFFETDDDGEPIPMSDEMVKRVYKTFETNNRYVMDDVNLMNFNKVITID